MPVHFWMDPKYFAPKLHKKGGKRFGLIIRQIMIFQKGTDEMLNTSRVDWNKMMKEFYYNIWIDLMEGHYTELFKSSVYSEAMVKTLAVWNEFVRARQTVVNDLLRQFNLPTNQDVDELAKEIYLLKKRMRAYEKREK